MSNSFSKKVQTYFKTHHQDLQFIFSKIKKLEELNAKIIAYLEPGLRNHCQVANLSEQRLTLLVANGSVATQLRFQTTDLLVRFKQDKDLRTIKEIHCKVRPPQAKPLSSTPCAKKMPLLSPETAEIIREIADSLQDPKLKAIMESIAEKTK